MNPKDPINGAGPNYERELFDRFSRASNGFPTDAVVSAAINVLINGLRQAHATRSAAETRFNELFGRTKQLLMDHYDANGRRKQGLFPFNQTIRAGFVRDEDKIHRH